MKERNVQLVRIDSGDDVSYHCVGESKNNCVEIYEGVLPSLIDHLLENQVEKIVYSSSYGKVPYHVKPFVPSLVSSSSGSSYFALYSNDINLTSFNNFLKSFSAMVGGSFQNSYDYLLPVPLLDSGKSRGYMRLLPREHLNAEAAPFLTGLLPRYSNILRSIISKSVLHSSRWYTVKLSITRRSLSLSQITYRIQLSLAFILDSRFSETHQSLSKDPNFLSLQRQSMPNLSLTLVPIQSLGVLKNTDSRNPTVLIDRQTQDLYNTEFKVVTRTSYPLQSIRSPPKAYIHVIETIPIYYSFYLHSLQYSLYRGNQTLLRSGNLFDFVDNFSISNPTCDSSGTDQVITSSCDFTFSFDYSLHLEESLEYTLTGRKNLLSLPKYPPDGSYGIYLIPAIIQFGWNHNETTQNLEVTELFLLQRPIPDLSMPFNVITLVGTLIAFLVGSIMNAWIRKHSSRKNS